MKTNLDLARAVFPRRFHTELGGEVWGRDEAFSGKPFEKFDPTGAHFSDVLAWLMSQDKCNDIDGHCIRVYVNGSQQATVEEHDGTAAGIREAVHRAALRVLQP